MNNQKKATTNIQGEPLDLEILLDFAKVDSIDMEHAAQWWDEHASIEWIGVLDSDPVDDGQ